MPSRILSEPAAASPNRASVRFLLRWVKRVLAPLGDPLALLGGLRNYPGFMREWRRYRRLCTSENVRIADWYPILHERSPAASIDPHYFYQHHWLLAHLQSTSPHCHVDVGSQVYLLSAASCFTNTIFVDIRSIDAVLPRLSMCRGSLLSLPFGNHSVRSLSCLHVIEHVGLGRYGGVLDPDGTRKACEELARVLAPEGLLYVSTPVGRQRTWFNAHRVHHPEKIVALFPDLQLTDFAAVDDAGRFLPNARPTQLAACEYALGLYRFRGVHRGRP
jgi:hypothetical protein